jgi:hypothetical protein
MIKFLIALLIPIQVVFSQEMDKFLKIDKTNSILFNQDLNDKKGLFPGINNLYKGSILKQADKNRYYAWLLVKADSVLKDSIIWLDEDKARTFIGVLLPSFSALQNESLFVSNILCNRAKLLSIYQGRTGKVIKYKGKEFDYKILNNSIFTFDDNFITNYNLINSIIEEPRWEVFTDDNDFFNNISIQAIKNDKLIVNQYDQSGTIDIKTINKIKYRSSSQDYIWGLIGIIIPYGMSLAVSSETNNVSTQLGFKIASLLLGITGALIGSTIYDEIEIDLQNKDYYDKIFKLQKETYFAIPDSSNH